MNSQMKHTKERGTHFVLSRSFLCWGAAALLMGFIVLIMPYALNIRVFLENHLGKQLGYLPETLFVLAGISLASIMLARPELRKTDMLAKIAILVAAYLFSLKFLTKFPIERFHYIEYSLLACFVYFAWNNRTSRSQLFFKTLLTASALGIAEEFAQGFVPGRSANPEDVFTNIFAVLLGVISSDMVITKLFPTSFRSAAKSSSPPQGEKLNITDERFE